MAATAQPRAHKRATQLSSPTTVRNYLQMKLTDKPNEVFAVVFLGAAFQVIVYKHMFNGTVNSTVNSTAVYPRVVVTRCLELHASAILVAHNHPSGRTAPSDVDQVLTKSLKSALQLLDIRLLDRFIIGKGQPFSFAGDDFDPKPPLGKRSNRPMQPNSQFNRRSRLTTL